MRTTLRIAAETEDHRIEEEWGSLTWLASRGIGNAEGVVFGRVVVKPGCSNPRHSHANCEEVLYLLQGQLEHSIGDDTISMEAGDTLVVEPGLVHNATNTGDEDADMIVAYSAGEREFQLEGSGE